MCAQIKLFINNIPQQNVSKYWGPPAHHFKNKLPGAQLKEIDWVH